jgi:long-chain acyl-CoA synthetase
VVFKPIKAATGGKLRGAISGGGLMPPHIDLFFQTIGVPILVGYGLTETSPVVAVRRERRNVLGTIGMAIPQVEVAVRDVATGGTLPPGEVGLIITRGPHVMQGYHDAPELTREVVDREGWFNTGDLGFLTEAGDLCFHGRAKETIVLAGGENVEPSHVESAILTSHLVQQVVVVGQDRKTLAALVLPQPEPVQKALGLDAGTDTEALAGRPDVWELLRGEVVKRTAGLAPFERVTRISVLPHAFDVEEGTLTQTLKLRRHVIVERYKELIASAYER